MQHLGKHFLRHGGQYRYFNINYEAARCCSILNRYSKDCSAYKNVDTTFPTKIFVFGQQNILTKLVLHSHYTRKYSSHVSDKDQNATSKWLTIPNLLTGFRLFASPYIGFLVLQHDFQYALALFVLVGITDSVDGWIARNVKGQSSVIGSFIDPLADKILISILTVTLTMVDIIPVILCGMIVLRDVLLITTSSHFHYKNLTPPKTMEKFFDFENSKVKMEPTQISKYNTFLQLGLVALSTAAPVFDFVGHPLLQAYWFLVGSTTVISGFSYVFKDKSAYRIKS